MRVWHLIEGDYTEDLRAEIITLLTTVSAEGIDEISTSNLLLDLNQQGFAVDAEGLMDILSTLEVVSVATSDTITIATSDVDAMVGDEAGNIAADRVDNMAADQATKDIGESGQEPRFRYGDAVIDDEGHAGEIKGHEKDGQVQVAYYNNEAIWVDIDRLELDDDLAYPEDEYLNSIHGFDFYDQDDDYIGESGQNPRFSYGDAVIDDEGNTGDFLGQERDGLVQVAYYNSGNQWVDIDRLELNDYAGSDHEEEYMINLHGPDFYDDDDTGDLEEDDTYDPAAKYREFSDAKLGAMKSYGLGKERDFARDEMRRRDKAGEKWKWDIDETKAVPQSIARMLKLSGQHKG